ncbi:hypothetical protein C4D60_Mb08t03880 [Musa balbisiana]|uniref:Uncharacterized protein n=1 Tax=Musa balbisiana TaxID=52838 RepID=A0A4S8K146_MUSBA|nr:hypothetical protein C4D60_Mb08t03880 [Musa balbisiana]
MMARPYVHRWESAGQCCQNGNPKLRSSTLLQTLLSSTPEEKPRSLPLLLSLLLLLLLAMDLVCPIEHLCYVRCTYCNTLLAVGVPFMWLMDRVTVNCGHCHHLSFLSPGDVVQCICPTSHLQMSLQGRCFGSRREPPSPRRSSTSGEQFKKAPFVLYDVVSAKETQSTISLQSLHEQYNLCPHLNARDEIQRIKAAKPDIPHREAFSMAAKNWANSDPRNSI